MKRIRMILFLGVVAISATLLVLSLSFKNNELKSLRANAGTKCVPATNSDCRSPSTDQIYCGYRGATIGGGKPAIAY